MLRHLLRHIYDKTIYNNQLKPTNKQATMSNMTEEQCYELVDRIQRIYESQHSMYLHAVYIWQELEYRQNAVTPNDKYIARLLRYMIGDRTIYDYAEAVQAMGSAIREVPKIEPKIEVWIDSSKNHKLYSVYSPHNQRKLQASKRRSERIRRAYFVHSRSNRISSFQ